jgi:hypothetical protein
MRNQFVAITRLLCLILLMQSAVSALAGELSDMDKMAIRDVIKAQLDAFKANNADLAFSYASPAVRTRSGNAGAFMEMVRDAYAPVYRARAVFFQNITMMEGVPAQRVLLLDAKGSPVLAIYPMEKQPDRTWRIDGCMLYRGNAQML